MIKYNFRVLTSASDNMKFNGPLTKNVKKVQWDDEVTLSVDVEANSIDNAHETVFEYIDDLFDQYYLISKLAIPIRDSDEIHIENLTEKKDEFSDYFSFSSVPFQLTLKERNFLFNNSTKFRNSEFKFLRLALQYHRKSKLATSLEDKIIYQVIALESLYSKENTEITFRFSRRLANLLGKTSKQRKLLAEQSNTLYRIRSQIVHGNTVKIDESLIIESEKWVRTSLFYFVSLMEKFGSRKNILNELDSSLIDEKIRTKLQKLGQKLLKQFE